MWAATRKLEKDLVERTGWLEQEDLKALFVVATLIPAPKFLSLAGLIGFRLGGWSRSLLAVLGLILPASGLVLAGVALIEPALLEGPLAPLNTAIGVAVVGLLFGNAYHQLRNPAASRRNRIVGTVLSAALFAAIVAGAPLVGVAILGFVLGPLLIRDRARPREIGEDT